MDGVTRETEERERHKREIGRRVVRDRRERREREREREGQTLNGIN
jgi:hypothetical protein